MFALDFRSGWLHDCLRPFRLLRRHWRYRNSEVRMRIALSELFRRSNLWLESLGVKYWLAYGTLLGYQREGALIPKDPDVDFALWVEDYPQVWEARHRLPRGLRLFNTSHRHHGPKLYLEYEGWEADLYFYRRFDGLAQSTERSKYLNETAPFPAEWIEPLQPVTLLQQSTWIPHQTEQLLKHTYGYLGRGGRRDPRTGYWIGPQGER
jgi:hypothetical protein